MCKGFFKRACGFNEDFFDFILKSVLEDKCGRPTNEKYQKLLGRSTFVAATGKEYQEYGIYFDRIRTESSKKLSSEDDVLAFLDEHFSSSEDFNPQQK